VIAAGRLCKWFFRQEESLACPADTDYEMKLNKKYRQTDSPLASGGSQGIIQCVDRLSDSRDIPDFRRKKGRLPAAGDDRTR